MAKALNKKNLVELGAETLADLVLDITRGNAALKRRARMELNANAGTEDVAREIRKRFATIGRSRGFVEWEKQRAFARELSDHVEMIEKRVAPEDPNEAFELLWTFLKLAPNIYERTDDSNGTIGDAMNEAMEAIHKIAGRLALDQAALADRVFEALLDNGYGEFDGAVNALGDALGTKGIEQLKKRAKAIDTEPVPQRLVKAYASIYGSGMERKSPEEKARDSMRRTANMILSDIADQEGDVDAYMARYSQEQLTFSTIAPGVAARLLAAGRHEEALTILDNCEMRPIDWYFMDADLDPRKIRVTCLEALGRKGEARDFLLNNFRETLDPEILRQHLAYLDDFDDLEVEEREKAWVHEQPDFKLALIFFLEWPDLPQAARLIENRHKELDGNAYEVLSPAAKTLGAEHPLATTLALRAMIEYSLNKQRSSRYGHAARHLKTCADLSNAIDDYGPHPNHTTFELTLKNDHGKKTGFWNRVDGYR